MMATQFQMVLDEAILAHFIPAYDLDLVAFITLVDDPHLYLDRRASLLVLMDCSVAFTTISYCIFLASFSGLRLGRIAIWKLHLISIQQGHWVHFCFAITFEALHYLNLQILKDSFLAYESTCP